MEVAVYLCIKIDPQRYKLGTTDSRPIFSHLVLSSGILLAIFRAGLNKSFGSICRFLPTPESVVSHCQVKGIIPAS